MMYPAVNNVDPRIELLQRTCNAYRLCNLTIDLDGSAGVM